MRNTSEGCILSEQQSALKKEVLSLDERMDKLEKDFATMRSETQDGFRQGAEVMREIGVSVSNLAHDFVQRFNNIETTVVAEKVKWGETLRWAVKIAVINAWTAFSLAQELAEDHPMFAAWFSAAKTALGVDDATAEELLAKCVKEGY